MSNDQIPEELNKNGQSKEDLLNDLPKTDHVETSEDPFVKVQEELPQKEEGEISKDLTAEVHVKQKSRINKTIGIVIVIIGLISSIITIYLYLNDSYLSVDEDLAMARTLYNKQEYVSSLKLLESHISLNKQYTKNDTRIKSDYLNIYGEITYHGFGPNAKNLEKAFKAFTNASEIGCGNADIHLGFMYRNGEFVKKDTIKSNQYFKKALLELDKESAKGNVYSQLILGEINLGFYESFDSILKGDSLWNNRNLKVSKKHFERTVDANNLKGILTTAFLYDFGIGCKQNKNYANELYGKANLFDPGQAHFFKNIINEAIEKVHPNQLDIYNNIKVLRNRNSLNEFTLKFLRTNIAKKDIWDKFKFKGVMLKKDPALIYLIYKAKSIDNTEKQKWLNLYSRLDESRIEKLYEIFLNEIEKLRTIELIYAFKNAYYIH